MDTVKHKIVGIPLGVIIALIVNTILFMGLPLLTQIQGIFRPPDPDSSIFLTRHTPPKPPDPERDKRLQERKPRKLKKDRVKPKARVRPKIDFLKFDMALGGDLAGSLQISDIPRQDLAPSMIQTAFDLSEVDQHPRIIRQMAPLYPFAAKRKNIQGSVTLRFIVTKEGMVQEPVVEKAEPQDIFNSSALKAIMRWRFKPAIKDGKPVDVFIVLPLKFELSK